ncbi:hypothetical protein Dsin_022162 [Dipteronia sinensis]|uniref:DDE-1 domain-containing protein n=1 Tax=Dipteronia sinensis TaxID=43782 RepID=A0AAE0E0W5_9ROSI|nr:hypothetical protein Dsin_022162 [Dipteronia sinensis]
MTNRKIMLLLDDCTAHVPLTELPNHIKLKNTAMHYLPPNLISKLQPCDAGIIRNFKAYYRRRFNLMLLEHLESNTSDLEKIYILEAIYMVVAALTFDVKPKTIVNCFLHCKIRTVQGETDGDIKDSVVMSEFSVVMSELEQ